MPMRRCSGGVDEEEPAERPERLAAHVRLGFLVEQQHLAPGVGQLGGRHQTGQPRPDHDDIGIHGCDPSGARASRFHERPFRQRGC